MIDSILEKLNFKDIELYEYNKIQIDTMLMEIYDNLDVDKENIISFLNNNLSDCTNISNKRCVFSKILKNKYIFNNIFYLYLLSFLKKKNFKSSEIDESIILFKTNFKINIHLILEIFPEEINLIQKIQKSYDKNRNLFYSKEIYINDLERNFQLIYPELQIFPKERCFSEAIINSYLETINSIKINNNSSDRV